MDHLVRRASAAEGHIGLTLTGVAEFDYRAVQGLSESSHVELGDTRVPLVTEAGIRGERFTYNL
jgi:hypothetical protein